MDYYTHVLNTTRDPALRVAAELALIRARLAHACGQEMEGQRRRVQASPAQPPRKQPRR